MVRRRTSPCTSIFACAALLCASAVTAQTVKQYEAEAIRKHRAQKAKAEAARRAAEAQERLHQREYQYVQRREEAESAEEYTRTQLGRICEESVAREVWGAAAHNCKIASEHGDVNATYRLGQMTANGLGIAANPVTGFKLTVKAARLGSEAANVAVCKMMYDGLGVEQSATNAAICYENFIDTLPNSSLRSDVEPELGKIYLLREAPTPPAALPSTVAKNTFQSAIERAIADNQDNIGYNADITVNVRLLVGADGKVKGCILDPSDNRDLMEVTCPAARDSMTFKPALGPTGAPVMSLFSFSFNVKTVSKACAALSNPQSNLRLFAALACKRR